MKKIALSVLLMVVSLGVNAQWQLSNADSNVNFVSVKKSLVGELHHFKQLSGSIDAGMATVEMDLSSVETNIPIRNERMLNMLFEVTSHPKAMVSAKVDTKRLKGMAAGDSYKESISMKLDLHGAQHEVMADVRVTKLANGGVSISSRSPILISAADYGLDKGVEALRKVAKLPSISASVPVSFDLVFLP